MHKPNTSSLHSRQAENPLTEHSQNRIPILAEIGPFASDALQCVDLSLIPIPIEPGTRKPLVNHWTGWKNNKAVARTETHIKKFPTANLGIVAKQSNIVVLDGDNAQANTALKHLSDVQIMIESERGLHVYLDAKRTPEQVNFRKYGIEIDMKGANDCDFVMAPPSLHHKSGKPYKHVGHGDYNARFELPIYTPSISHHLIEELNGSHAKAEIAAKEYPDREQAKLEQQLSSFENGPRSPRRSAMEGPYYEGERRNTLNDRCCAALRPGSTFDDLLKFGRHDNATYANPPQSEDEVIEIVSRVWKDRDKLKPNNKAQISRDKLLFDKLQKREYGNGLLIMGYIKFLDFIIEKNRYRVLNGETFLVMPEPLKENFPELYWMTKKQIRTATERLKDAGLIIYKGKVKTKGHNANSYTFPEWLIG